MLEKKKTFYSNHSYQVWLMRLDFLSLIHMNKMFFLNSGRPSHMTWGHGTWKYEYSTWDMSMLEIGHIYMLYKVLEVENHNVPQKESDHWFKCHVIIVLDQVNIKLNCFFDWWYTLRVFYGLLLSTSVLPSVCKWKEVESWNWQPISFHKVFQKWLNQRWMI